MQIVNGHTHNNNYADYIFVSHNEFVVVKVDILFFTSDLCSIAIDTMFNTSVQPQTCVNN